MLVSTQQNSTALTVLAQRQVDNVVRQGRHIEVYNDNRHVTVVNEATAETNFRLSPRPQRYPHIEPVEDQEEPDAGALVAHEKIPGSQAAAAATPAQQQLHNAAPPALHQPRLLGRFLVTDMYGDFDRGEYQQYEGSLGSDGWLYDDGGGRLVDTTKATATKEPVRDERRRKKGRAESTPP